MKPDKYTTMDIMKGVRPFKHWSCGCLQQNDTNKIWKICNQHKETLYNILSNWTMENSIMRRVR